MLNWLRFLFFVCREFEKLSASGEKVGEPSKALAAQLAAMQAQEEDTSCGYAEEGQDGTEMVKTKAGEQTNDDSTV